MSVRPKVFLLCLSVFLPCVPWLPAQTRDAARGRKVLEAAIEALGGPAFLEANNFRSEGRAFQFSRYEELSGMARFVAFERLPDKYRQEYGKDRDVIFVLNGEHGWEKTFRGVQELPPEEIERIRLNRSLAVENILRFRRNEEGLEVAYTGTDLVDGRAADLVEIVDSQNRTVTIAFDQASHLPLRRAWERRNPKTRERELNEEILGKYLPAKPAGKAAKTAAKVLAPYYTRRERNGIKIFEVFLTGVEYNVKIAASHFERPPGPERAGPRRR